MSVLDWVLLGVLAIAVCFALRGVLRARKKGGCCGCCQGCKGCAANGRGK